MAVVREPVDDGDGAVFCKVLHFLLFEGADHDAVEITGKDARGIFDRFAPADLQVVVGEEQPVAAQLVDARLKGDAGARRGLLEDHAELLTLQIGMEDAVLALVFELVGKV